jgi:hypothetical protein
MRTAAGGGRALADNSAATHNHASHGRIGRGPPEHPARERKRFPHETKIGG